MYILCYQLLTRFASTESPLVSACRYSYKLYIELRHLVNLFYTFPRKLSRNGTSAQVFDEISMFKNKKTAFGPFYYIPNLGRNHSNFLLPFDYFEEDWRRRIFLNE